MLFRRAAYGLGATLLLLPTGCNVELGPTAKKPVVPERNEPAQVEREPTPPVAAVPAATPDLPKVETPAVAAPARPGPAAEDKARWVSSIDVLEKIYLDLDDFAYGRVNAQYNAAECQAYCEKLYARLADARKPVEPRAFPLDERLYMAAAYMQSMVEMANPKHPTLGANVRLNQYSSGKKKFTDELQAVKFAMLE